MGKKKAKKSHKKGKNPAINQAYLPQAAKGDKK